MMIMKNRNAEMCHYQGLLHFISNHNDYDCYGYNQKYKCRNIFVSEYLYERSSEHSSAWKLNRNASSWTIDLAWHVLVSGYISSSYETESVDDNIF